MANDQRECFHRGWLGTDGPWRVGRCAHVDNRCVVETLGVADWACSFVDYVEYNGLHAVLVEGHHVHRGESTEEAWHYLVDKMMRGEPPEDGF